MTSESLNGPKTLNLKTSIPICHETTTVGDKINIIRNKKSKNHQKHVKSFKMTNTPKFQVNIICHETTTVGDKINIRRSKMSENHQKHVKSLKMTNTPKFQVYIICHETTT